MVLLSVGGKAIGQSLISGKVVEEGSNEPLPYASILIKGYDRGTTTNIDGYFTLLDLPEDAQELEVSFVGYRTTLVSISELSSLEDVVIAMVPDVATLEEVTVSGMSSSFIEPSSQPSTISISPRQMEMLPSLGQPDLFRSMQFLPGISGTNENTSGLFIRGGSPDQNLVLLDGMTVYKVDHFYGLFSAFNSKALKDAQLYKGVNPARFGGRLSGVVDLTGKTGSFSQLRGGVNLNLLSAGGYIEVPIVKDKLSFLFAGRRSYTDVLQSGLYKNLTETFRKKDDLPNLDEEFTVTELQPKFYFFDLNSKLSYKPGEKDLISLSVYSGRDFLDESRTIDRVFPGDIFVDAAIGEKTDWGNRGVSARWSRQWSPRLFSSVIMAGSEYFSTYDRLGNLDITVNNGDSVLFSGQQQTNEDNSVRDITGRVDLEWIISPTHKLDFGGSYTLTDVIYESIRDDTVTILSRDQSAAYYSLFVGDTWKPGNRMELNVGFRASGYEYSPSVLFEPRVSLSYRLFDRLKLKGAYGTQNQFVNRIINESITEGSRDFWLLADEALTPVSSATHWVGGASYERDDWILDVEGYYKELTNISEFSLRFRTGLDIQAEELFFVGDGIAKGVEFLLQKKHGKFTGWASYTLSSVRHTFPDFNEGKSFPALQDQLHELKLVGNLQSDDWVFGWNFVYGSGRPFSEPEGFYSIELLDGRKLNYVGVGAKNGARLPPYWRLDLSAHFFFKIGKAKGDAAFSIFNFFNRRNVWYYEYDFSQDPFLVTEVLFLGFTPNVSLSVDF